MMIMMRMMMVMMMINCWLLDVPTTADSGSIAKKQDFANAIDENEDCDDHQLQ